MNKTPRPHLHDSDSTDYDTKGDNCMNQVLAEMPLPSLLLAPSLLQLLPATSGAGQQQPPPPKQQPPPLLLPPPPMPPPTTSRTSGAELLRQALHMLPASEAEQAVPPKQPLSPAVQSLLDTHSEMQKKEKGKEKEQKKADRLLMASPTMALPKPAAGPCTLGQVDVVHQVLIETEDAGAA